MEQVQKLQTGVIETYESLISLLKNTPGMRLEDAFRSTTLSELESELDYVKEVLKETQAVQPIRIETGDFAISDAMARDFNPVTAIVELSPRDLKDVEDAYRTLQENYGFYQIEIWNAISSFELKFLDEDEKELEYEFAGASSIRVKRNGEVYAKLEGVHDTNEWLEVEISEYLSLEK